MKNILDEIKTKPKLLNKPVVLCEGEDKRVVKAAADCVKEGVAKIVLLGDSIRMGYDKYVKEGDAKRSTLSEFNSSNTEQLSIEEVTEKLLALQYIKEELEKE